MAGWRIAVIGASLALGALGTTACAREGDGLDTGARERSSPTARADRDDERDDERDDREDRAQHQPRTTTSTRPPRTAPTTTEPPPTTPPPAAPPATDPPVTAPPRATGVAPVGATAVGVWWHPSADQFTAASLWTFDPIGEAVPYGAHKNYQPTGVIGSVETQWPFTYTEVEPGLLSLSYPTGTSQELQVVDHDPAGDVLTVVWDGHDQTWFGCSSGRLPAHALAACP